jgi:hypothetical protein
MKIRRREILAVLALLTPSMLCGHSSAYAQAINDSNQGQTYGNWRVGNSQYPGIEVRAKCDNDNTSTTPVSSYWEYQIRSTYKRTMDYVYLVEGGIASPKNNVMTGPFLDTVKPGEIKNGGVQLWGGCGQHATPKTDLHITIKCGVPTGQDAPCFKDSDGNPIARQEPSKSQPPRVGSKSVPSPSKTASARRGSMTGSVWVCTLKYSDGSGWRREISFLSNGRYTSANPDDRSVADNLDETDRWNQNGNEVSWVHTMAFEAYKGTLTSSSMTGEILKLNPDLAPTRDRIGSFICEGRKPAEKP